MKTYKIRNIKRKADRIPDGHLYLEDCISLSSRWDKAEGIAEFTDEAVAEIKSTWTPKTKPPSKPCTNCKGL